MRKPNVENVEHSAAGAAATELILEVFRTNGLLLAEADRLAAPLGVTSARWQVMGALAQGPATVAQIARDMGITRQSVQRLVDVLAAEDLVVFEPNPGHRRAMLARLTPDGERKYAEISRIQIEWINRLSKDDGARTFIMASKALSCLRRRIREATPERAG
jgi:DNA-binding MarR family transcriptional regulator